MALLPAFLISPSGAGAVNAAPSFSGLPEELLSLSPQEIMVKGKHYADAGRQDSALICYATLAGSYDEKDSEAERRLKIEAKIEAGRLYYFIFYDYGKAYSYFQDAVELAEKHSFHDLLAYGVNNIGNVLSIYNATDYSEARSREILNCYIRSLDYAMKSHKLRVAVAALNNMMAMAMDSTCLHVMKPYLQKFCRIASVDSIPDGLFTINRIKAYLDAGHSDFGSAVARLRPLISDTTAIEEKRNMIQAYFDLAGFYSAMGRPDSTLYFVAKVRDISEKEHLYEVIPGAWLMEADTYGAMGDLTRRDRAMLSYYASKDSLLDFSNITLYTEPHLKKRIADIDVELVRVAEESRRRQLIIIFGSVFLVMAVGFVFAVERKNRALRKKNMEMVEKTSLIDRQERIIVHQTINEMKRQPHGERQGNPELLAAIIDVMENSQEIFNSDFSVDRLAQLCGEKSKTVSAELNASLGKNFNTLINEYRVREMCRRLSDAEYASLTIEAISQGVGFKSRSTSVSAFKKHTGVTPSEYLKAKKRSSD